MSRYSEGVRVERIVIHDLQANGYETTRAASSKGVADCIAIKEGQVLLVNIKRTTNPGPGERATLLSIAALIPGILIPLVAMKPTRQPLTYRRLTGPRPGDWEPWTPDELGLITAQTGQEDTGAPHQSHERAQKAPTDPHAISGPQTPLRPTLGGTP